MIFSCFTIAKAKCPTIDKGKDKLVDDETFDYGGVDDIYVYHEEYVPSYIKLVR